MPTKRKRADGGCTFYVKRTFAGVGPVYRSLGTRNKGRARTLEAMLVSLHDQGRFDLVRAFRDGAVPIETLTEHYESSRIPELADSLGKDAPPTVAAACVAALRAKGPDVKAGTLARYAEGLVHFENFAGPETSVRDALTTDAVGEFKGARLAEGAARETVNNDVGAVSILASYALRQKWISERPEIKRFKYKTRIRYLEPDQLTVYMATLRRPFRTQMLLLVSTGLRLGESEGLRTCDLRLNGNDSRVLVEDSKTPAGRRAVFVPPWAAEAVLAHVDEHGLSGTDQLFTIPRRVVQAEHNRAAKLAGISDYTIHDHRHTAAVSLARAGMPLGLLQQQLGHANVAMTMKYATFNPDYSDVHRYFQAMGERFGLVAPGNVSGNVPHNVRPEAESFATP
ncbi:MAG: site-specific integrase [Longimicrobiales bacterium]|nr:site-specific integrase [Longimicrobiales bacterium]